VVVIAGAPLMLMDELFKLRGKFEAALEGLGFDQIGADAIRERLAHVTERRDLSVKNFCHSWSKSVVATAIRFKCRTIVFDEPAKDVGLKARSWQWSTFKTMCKYKAQHCGLVFLTKEEADLEKLAHGNSTSDAAA